MLASPYLTGILIWDDCLKTIKHMSMSHAKLTSPDLIEISIRYDCLEYYQTDVTDPQPEGLRYQSKMATKCYEHPEGVRQTMK
jgi:hypothetical protein